MSTSSALQPHEAYALKSCIEGLDDKWRSLSLSPLLMSQLKNLAAIRAKISPVKLVEALSMLYDAQTMQYVHQMDTSIAPAVLETIERTWDFFDLDQLRKLPQAKYLVPGFLLETGLTVVYGPSGIGKSFFVLHTALQLSTTMPVVYMATEGESGYRSRVDAWEQFHRKKAGNITFCMGSVSMMEAGPLDLFTSDLLTLTPKVLVIDTMGVTMLPGDENSSRDMLQFIRAAKRLRKQLDCSVVLVHHTNKGGQDERGSSALKAAADTMIKLSADDDQIVVECAKIKDDSPFPPIRLRQLPIEVRDGGNIAKSIVLVDAGLVKRSRTDLLTKNQRKVLEAVSELDSGEGAIAKDVESLCAPMSTGPVIKALKQLLNYGFVEQEAPREPYRLSVDGTRKLKSEQEGEKNFNDTSEVSPMRALFGGQKLLLGDGGK